MIDEYFKLGHRFVNAVRRIWIGYTIALCAWLMAAGSAGALTDPLSSVDPRPPGPYPVGCSDVAQNFVFAPGDNDRANYWEGTSIGGQGHYVTQLLVEPQGTLTYDVNVPDVRGLFTTFAGQPVPYAAIVVTGRQGEILRDVAAPDRVRARQQTRIDAPQRVGQRAGAACGHEPRA